MVNDIRILSGSSHPAFSQAICRHLGVPLSGSRTIRFSNENMRVEIDDNVREADVFVVQTSCAPVSDGLVELLIMIDALKHASARRITAVLPYYPYARSDKKDQPRISITARLMADLLETAGADRVLTMDLHASQVQGFFRIPSDQLRACSILCRHLAGSRDLSDYVLVAADVGEAKGIGSYANRLDLPIAVVDKRRDGHDEVARAVNLIGDVRGRRALIIDDEVASGGTLLEAISFLHDNGAVSVEACAVHGVLSGRAIERISAAPLTSLLLTDTIPLGDRKQIDKIEVCTVAPLFAEAIKAIHTGSSISKLFC